MQTLLRGNRVADALFEARAGVLTDPKDAESHELLIDILMNLGLGYEAQSSYQAFAQERPNDPLAWALLGRASLGIDESRSAYNKSMALDPRFGRAWMGLASIDRAEGNPGKAADKYRQAVAMDPSLAEAWTALGGLLIQEQRWDDAVANCHAAIKGAPKDPEAYLALAELRPEESLETLKAGVAAVPDEPRLYVALGRELLERGDYEQARASLRRALAIYPGEPQATLDLAVADELEAGVIDKPGRSTLARARALAAESPLAAKVELDALASSYPKSHLVLLARGHLHSEQGNTRAAEADLRKALQLAPKSPDVQATLGLLYFSMEKYPEALALLTAARAQRPYDASLAISAGLSQVAVDGPAKGLKALDQVARQFPTDTRVIMAIVGVLSQAGDVQGAYTVLKRAVGVFPDPGLILTLAAAAKDLGRFSEAAELLRRMEGATGDPKYGRMARDLEAKAP